jgi:hypothetical protein
MSKRAISAFVKALQGFQTLPSVFNPWRDVDPLHDLGVRSPTTRTDHLRRYLEERVGRARITLVAEGLGYQGGHFSGVAMTSERILLGNLAKKKGIRADDVIRGGGQRTSRVTPNTPALGTTEPTATIVWGAMKTAGIDTRDVVLWNAFAMHPMKGVGSWLTNRKPTDEELKLGKPLLEQFLALFPGAKTVAVGQVSEDLLNDLGVAVAAQVRHPMWGGANEFRAGFAQLPKLLR